VQCADHLSGAKLGSVAWCTGVEGCKRLETNKEEETSWWT
jgi:hypothetical protein